MHPQHRHTPAARRPSLHQRRKGAIWVLACAIMVVLVALAALSVDIAYMNLCRTQLRAATDAAARAGGEALSRSQSISIARQAAKDLAAQNIIGGSPLLLDDSDIVFGSSTQNANGTWSFASGATPTNSVQVIGSRTRYSRGGSIGLFFGRLFNVNEFEPSLTASVVKLDRDICVVLDRSSSMKLDLASTSTTMSTSDSRFGQKPNSPDSRWAALVNAVDAFVAALNSTPQEEQVAVASFSSNYAAYGVNNAVSSLDLPLTKTTSGVSDVAQNLAHTIFNGSTNTAAGLDRGIEALTDTSRARPFARKVLVFMTDGFRTQGGDPLASARAAAEANIVIYTVTFGATFDQSEMEAVANITGGKHYHAPDAATLTEVFRTIAEATNVILTQ